MIIDRVAAGINMRGMSVSQKGAVIQCERRRMSQPKRVIDEFTRLATAAIASNESVIPAPTTDMSSSFLSNRKKTARNEVAVSKITFQDLARFAFRMCSEIVLYYMFQNIGDSAVIYAILRTFLLHY